MTIANGAFIGLALALGLLSGCDAELDECSEADQVAQRILDEAAKDGLAPETVCANPDRAQKYDELCESHAALLAECED